MIRITDKGATSRRARCRHTRWSANNGCRGLRTRIAHIAPHVQEGPDGGEAERTGEIGTGAQQKNCAAARAVLEAGGTHQS